MNVSYKGVSLWKLWNTWDVECVNCIVYLPLSLEFRVGLFDGVVREFVDKFRRSGVRLGTRDPDFTTAHLQLGHRGSWVSLRIGKPDPYVIVGEVRGLNISGEFSVVFEALNIWGGGGVLSYRSGENAVVVTYRDHDEAVAASFSGVPVSVGVYGDEGDVRMDLETLGSLRPMMNRGSVAAIQYPLGSGGVVYFALAVSESVNDALIKVRDYLRSVDDVLRRSEEDYERRRVKVTGGEFNGVAQAIMDAVSWNTVWDPYNARMYTVVSREWASGPWYGYLLFEWDTFFNALLASVGDCEIAEANIKSMLSEILPRGVLPNWAGLRMGVRGRASADRAQPPVASYITWRVYLKCGDLTMLKWAYPYLKRFHEWWFKARDGNNDGLLEWGSDPVGGDKSRHTLRAAKFESGLDNSPMYDDAEFVDGRNVMNIIDVGLNSLYALDALSLSLIASELNLVNDAEAFRREYEEVKRRINEVLWSEDNGIYLNRYWSGAFSNRKSPTCLYPLIAGIPSVERAGRIVKEHLLNPREFWGEYVIPSISRDDPAYRDNNYWRGRIWGPMNYIVYEGLRRYGFDEVAYEFALKSVKLFMGEWLKNGHYHENYNAETGEGDDVPNSDPYYSWGALLALIGLEELISVDENGINFGSLSIRDVNEVDNYVIGRDSYSVKVGPSILEAYRNGKLFLRANRAVAVRGYVRFGGYVEFSVRGRGLVSLSVIEFNPNEHALVCIDGECGEAVADSNGAVNLSIDFKDGGVRHVVIVGFKVKCT